MLSSLQAWQRWSTAEAGDPGSGGPLNTAISDALHFQDRASHAIASVDQALAQTSPAYYYDFFELAVASAASGFPAPGQERQFFALSADTVRLVKQKQEAIRWATWLADQRVPTGVLLTAQTRARLPSLTA
eukprot:4587887-Pyramimonas_sp.AAC.1